MQILCFKLVISMLQFTEPWKLGLRDWGANHTSGNRINSYEWMTDDSERGEAIGNEEEQGYREGIQRGRTEMEGHLSSRIEA